MEQVLGFIRSIFDVMTSCITVYPVNVVFYIACVVFIVVLIKRQLLVSIKRNKK